MSDERPLWEKMRELIQFHTGVGAELEEKAAALEAATHAIYAENSNTDDVKRMLGCWARARLLYCDVTGEDLL